MPNNAPDIVEIAVDLTGVEDYTALDSVGSLYEIGINGVGYMLEDLGQENPYRRFTPNLEPERLTVSDTPFSQSFERYIFSATNGWQSGAGQKFLDREDSLSTAFWTSAGVDPFLEEGEISLAPGTALVRSETFATPRLAVAGANLYVQSGASQVTWTNDLTTWTPLTVTGLAARSSAGKDFTSDGVFWYLADTAGIIRGTTSDPGADWSSISTTHITYAAGRIMVAEVVAPSSTPNRFTTLNDAGAEEKTSGHITFDDGTSIVFGEATQGYFYFGLQSGDRGSIWAWKLGLDSTGSFHVPFLAWELPTGLVPAAVGQAGGSIWVKAFRPDGAGGAGQTVMYRGIPGQDGAITPFYVAELAGIASTAVHNLEHQFAEKDNELLFAWPGTSLDSGLGYVNLVTGGYAKYVDAGVSGGIHGVTLFKGNIVFSVAGSGVYEVDPATYKTTGTVTMSIADGGSPLDKVFDSLTVTMAPIGASQSLSFEASTDGGVSFNPVYLEGTAISTIDQAGLTRITLPVRLKAPSLMVRMTLTGPGTTTPTVAQVDVKYHQLGLSDTVVVVPILCADNTALLSGQVDPESHSGYGALQARTLQDLAGQRVLYQDIDYKLTNVAEVFEVIQTDKVGVGIMNRSTGQKNYKFIVTMTLRKEGAYA